MLKLMFKKLNANALVPSAGSQESAGYDLCACTDSEEIVIAPHETVKVGTGLAIAIPHGYFGAIFARSGLATKQSLRPANCVGVCDSDYRGEYIVPIHNDSGTSQSIKNGERIAQLIVLPCQQLVFEETDELDETGRGEGGFGSTGK